VDFDAVSASFPAGLNAASYNLWNASIWSTIVDAAKGYQQLNPNFGLDDHTGDGLFDPIHLSLLANIINDDPCARSLLGNATMDAIQYNWMMNRNTVVSREFSFTAWLTDYTRANGYYSISINNAAARTDPIYLKTNTTTSITICVDAPLVGWTCLDPTEADIPSMWGAGGVLDTFAPGFDRDLADLFAAYLTIGDQNQVDYMQHIIASVLIDGFRPNMVDWILDLVATMLKSDEQLKDGEVPEAPDLGGEKNYTIPAVADLYLQQPAATGQIDIGDGNWVEITRVGLFIVGADFQAGLVNWLNSYQLGTAGLAPQVYDYVLAGQPGLLRGDTGDLNGDSQTNLASYTLAAGSPLLYRVNEDAETLTQFLWYSQPTSASPLDYGSSVTYNVHAYYDGGGVNYQWFRGTDAGDMVAVAGQTSPNWAFATDFYSVGGDTRDRFYQVSATTLKCGLPETIYSSVVQIVGGAPPAMTITGATGGGNFLPGASVILAVSASCPAG